MVDSNSLINSSIADKCKLSYKHFVWKFWHVLEKTPLEWGFHVDAIALHLESVFYGWLNQVPNAIRELSITVPPGCLKSRLTSVMWPAWMWLHDPSWQGLFTSVNPRVALRDAMLCRRLIESEEYQNMFKPQWKLADWQNAKSNYQTTKGGVRLSIGSGSHIIGERFDGIVYDDLHSADEVNSDLIRSGTIEWFNSSASTRIRDPRRSFQVQIGQRLHEHDIAAHVKSLGWTELCIPMEFNPVRKCVTSIWSDPRTVAGELMLSKRFTPEFLKKERTKLTEYGYAAQYLQNPMAEAGNLFRRDWIRYFEEDGDYYILEDNSGKRLVKKSDCKRFMSGDFAYTTKTSSDYTVISTWDITPDNDMVLVNMLRDKMEDPQIEIAIDKLFVEFNPIVLIIEAKANGGPLFQRLSRKTNLRVKAINVSVDKVTRSLPLRVDCGNGKVFYKKQAPYLEAIVNEMLRFPAGSHDDIIDSFSQAASFRQELTMGPSGFLPFSIIDPERAELKNEKAKQAPEDFTQTELTGGVTIQNRQPPQNTNTPKSTFRTIFDRESAWD